MTAGLRAANARLRELLAQRDAQVTALAGEPEEQRRVFRPVASDRIAVR